MACAFLLVWPAWAGDARQSRFHCWCTHRCPSYTRVKSCPRSHRLPRDDADAVATQEERIPTYVTGFLPAHAHARHAPRTGMHCDFLRLRRVLFSLSSFVWRLVVGGGGGPFLLACRAVRVRARACVSRCCVAPAESRRVVEPTYCSTCVLCVSYKSWGCHRRAAPRRRRTAMFGLLTCCMGIARRCAVVSARRF